MDKSFDNVLDQCITLVMQGVPVADCLARYPEHAAELEPELQLIIQFAPLYGHNPSVVAIERSRHLVYDQLEVLAREDRARNIQRTSWAHRLAGGLSATPKRWAVMAAALVLAIVMAGTGTAVASNNSLPGEAIYPVKRAIEELRLAIAGSDEARARLHISFAERRANEIGSLLIRGKADTALASVTALDRHLTVATGSASDGDKIASNKRMERLDESASEALASLEDSVAATAVEIRLDARSILDLVGSHYSAAFEAVSSRIGPKGVGPSGTAEIWITNLSELDDDSEIEVDSLLVEVRRVQVYEARGASDGWVTILVGTPQTVDLLAIGEAHQFIGQAELGSGTYTRIRFDISKVSVVEGSVRHSVQVSDMTVELQRPFHIFEGKNTAVFLDFDSVRSLSVSADGIFRFAPSVSVRIRETGGSPRAPSKPVTQRRTSGTPTPSKTLTLVGLIGHQSQGNFLVDGKIVVTDSLTEVVGALELGARVKVLGSVQNDEGDEILIARRIEVLGAPKKIQVTGVVDAIDDNQVTVAGSVISLLPQTEVIGEVAINTHVTVDGVLGPGGTTLANRVETVEESDVQLVPQATPAAIPAPAPATPTPTQSPAPTTPTPTQSPPPSATPTPHKYFVITGTLSSVTQGIWVVGGIPITVNSSTEIRGAALVGLMVRIEGIVEADGSRTARLIVFLP